jgi:DNA-binding transcriptional ArsR family regulator
MAEPRRRKGRKGGKTSGAPSPAGRAKSKGRPIARQGNPAKKSPERPSALPGYRLMKALGHPLRLQLLAILADRVASPKEISDELNETIGDVNYHAKVLQDNGLIVEDHQVPRRGAVEHFYRAAAATVIPPGAWDGFPGAVRKGVSVRILKEFLDDVRASMVAGIFDVPPAELSWTPLILDQTGIEEVGQLAREFLESVMAVQVNASERLPKEKSERAAQATSATVFLASFLSARSPGDDKKASFMKRR